MKKILLIAGLFFAFAAVPAFADVLEVVPHPTSVWDTTNGHVLSLGIPGQGTNGLTNVQTMIPSVSCGATCTLGQSNLGATTLLNQAAGSTATLPTATGSGTFYAMMVSVLTTSGAEKILTNTTDTIVGTAIGENGGTAKIFVGNAGTYHSIQMPNSGSQPSGGFIGDAIVCTDVASTIWQCNIVYQAGTTPTTPYSASTT
jgi:hypothetical protein